MASATLMNVRTATPVQSRTGMKSVRQQPSARRAVLACRAQQGERSLLSTAAAASAAALLAISGPALASPLFQVADVTGTEQSDRRGLGPNEVDRKDLESFPNASKKDATVPNIQEVAKPGKKQAPVKSKLGPEATSGVEAPKGKGDKSGPATIGRGGAKDSNKAMDGFFARLRGQS